MKNWEKIDRDNIWHPFSPLAGNNPLFIKKAKGAYLYTSDGRKILDAISSWWVNIHGHANKRIAKAISKQSKKLEQVIFAGFTHKPAIKLSEQLLKVLPEGQSKLFFSDNGSTSTEVALKLSIQYWFNRGIKRQRVIAFEGAYHGDTFGAMSVGDRTSIFNMPFTDFLFDVDYLPFPKGNPQKVVDKMRAIASDQTAAFIFEPLVQGAAGMRMYSPKLLDQLLAIAKEKEIICIADEVMTGFGRTGKTFACDYLEEQPDIFCLSKGLTGGFLPMGITSVNQRIASAFDHADKAKAFFHGHSYTANPMACAAGVESLKILLEPDTQSAIAMIAESHSQFIEKFDPPNAVEEVRQTGTILAIELKVDDGGYVSGIKEKIYDHFLDLNLLLRPLGNVIYLIPPYVIKEEELKTIYNEIEKFIYQLQE